jgi:quercetin dioxygenase-like cupin family protein
LTKKSLALTAVGTIVVCAAVLSARQQKDDSLDPVRVAPDTHKVAFENTFVRVLEVRIPRGSIEPRHRHPHGLSIYLTDWEAKVTNDGAAPQVNHRKSGSVAWSDAVIHTVQNVGSSEGHVFRIELKQ